MGRLVVEHGAADQRRGYAIGWAGLALMCRRVCLLIGVTMSMLDGADQRDRNRAVGMPISLAVPMWSAC